MEKNNLRKIGSALVFIIELSGGVVYGKDIVEGIRTSTGLPQLICIIIYSIVFITLFLIHLKIGGFYDNRSLTFILLIFILKLVDKSEMLSELNRIVNEKIRRITGESYESKRRIAILLPLSTGNDDHYREEMEYAFVGFGKGFKKVFHKLDKFEIIYLNHANNIEATSKLILNEMRRGTQYFICTMSNVCQELTNPENSKYYFDNLIKEFSDKSGDKEWKAILLCTIASSSAIKCKNNLIYRFFISAFKETDEIVNRLHELLLKDSSSNSNNTSENNSSQNNKDKRLVIIYNDIEEHSYTKEAVERYESEWKAKYSYPVTRIAIKREISDKIDDLEFTIKSELTSHKDLLEAANAIVIITFGNNFNKIITQWLSNNKEYIKLKNKIVVFPSVFSGLSTIIENGNLECHDSIKKLIVSVQKEQPRNESSHYGIYYSIPKKENSEKKFYGTVAEYFAMASIYRLISVASKINDLSEFHKNWSNLKLPFSLMKVSYDPNFDSDPQIGTELRQLRFNKKTGKVDY